MLIWKTGFFISDYIEKITGEGGMEQVRKIYALRELQQFQEALTVAEHLLTFEDLGEFDSIIANL